MEAAEAHAESTQPEAERRRRGRGGAHSGRLLLRMPETLHAELARLSEAEGVSLNSFINRVLEGAVGRQRGRGTEAAAEPVAAAEVPAAPASEDDRSPLLRRLLVANLLVVAAVGVLAIVLLVAALR